MFIKLFTIVTEATIQEPYDQWAIDQPNVPANADDHARRASVTIFSETARADGKRAIVAAIALLPRKRRLDFHYEAK